MPRPRALARQPRASEPDAPAAPQASPLAAVPPEPAPAQPERTPARQRLADEISHVAALQAEIRETSAAVGPAQEAVFAAQRALDAAEATLKGARPSDTYYAPPPSSYSVWGSQAEFDAAERAARVAAAGPPISIAEAEAAVKVAKDALDSSRRTRQWYEDRVRTLEQRLHSDRHSIASAVRNLLRYEPATLALAVECRRLNTRAAAAREAFGQIIHGDTIQPGSPFYGWDVVADARSCPEAMADWSVSRDWRAAIEALATDPDAALPTA